MKILKSILNYIPLATFIIFVVTDGIISLTSAFPKEKQVSQKQIRGEEQASSRALRTGRGTFPVRSDVDESYKKAVIS